MIFNPDKSVELYLVAAPMAGISDYPFRKLCFENGARIAFTEMISAKSVTLNLAINEKYFPKEDEKEKVGIQLFGNEVKDFVKAVEIVQSRGRWIDINAACPVRKVVKKGAGSALLLDLEKLSEIIKSIKSVAKVPVTVKTRLGWEDDDFERIYNTVVDSGADAIFVHGRTAKQMYSGNVKWDIYNPGYVPLFISGNIYSCKDAKKAIELSKANGALVARGAIGNPWMFSCRKPSKEEILSTVEKHVNLIVTEYGKHGVVEFRKFVAGYTKGLTNAKEFRDKVMRIKDPEEIKRAFREFLRSDEDDIFSSSR